VNASLVVDVKHQSTDNGANLLLWESNKGYNQQFQVMVRPKIKGSHYPPDEFIIRGRQSGKLITVRDDQVVQWDNDATDDSQVWKFESLTIPFCGCFP
jgi:hypothetical protein